MGGDSDTLRGKLQVLLDSEALSASLLYTADPNGESWDRERVEELLRAEGLTWGREGEDQLGAALRALSDVAEGTRTVVALSGQPPEDSVDETIEWQSLPIPQELAAEAEIALAAALPPKVYDIQVTRQKVEQTRTRKPSLPFLKAKVEKVVRTVRKEQRIEVGVDPKPIEVGYARKGDVLGVIQPGRPGRDGRNLWGDPIPARKPARIKLLLGTGISLRGPEVRAEVEGFYRRGPNWVDIVPYRRYQLHLYASEDKATCLLDFAPGTTGLPSVEEVLEKAREAGFAPGDLIPRDEIAALLGAAHAEGRGLVGEAISRAQDGEYRIELSADRMRATLSLRKGSGAGKPLSLAEVGKAINAQGFEGLDTARVREDILAFYRSSDRELIEYVLAEGTPAFPGIDARVDWSAQFVSPERAAEIERRLGEEPAGGFAATEIQAVAFVKAGQPVARVVAPRPGRPGRDVFGAEVPPEPGRPVEVVLDPASLRQEGDTITALREGVLEVAGAPGVVRARVREYHEGELEVKVSESRMEAFLSLFPPAGSTPRLEVVRAAIRNRGVVKGVDEKLVAELVERAARGQPVRDVLIARGKPPVDERGGRLRFHGQVVMGRSFLLADSGDDDRPRNLRVRAGDEVATIEPPLQKACDGYDVTGNVLPARRATALDIKIGPNVEKRVEPDGRVRFLARKAGEVFYDGALLDVRDVLVVEGGLGGGGPLARFEGSVRIEGMVRSGARVFCAGDVHVSEGIERATISSEGSIFVGGRINSSGGAVLRAKNDISAVYAERATLLAVGEIRLQEGCVDCEVRSNARLVLEGAEARLVGGRVKARGGVRTRHLGSPDGVRTEISFGQDYLVEDRIGVESRQIERLRREIAEIDARIRAVTSGSAREGDSLAGLSREKVRRLRQIEQHRLRLFALREKLEIHFPSEVRVEGTLYPGVVFESHGRTLVVEEPRSGVVVSFDEQQGRISWRPLDSRTGTR